MAYCGKNGRAGLPQEMDLIDIPVGPVLFNFRIGEWTMLRLSRPLQSWNPPLMEAPPPQARPLPPQQIRLAPLSLGFALRGLPVEGTLPKIERRDGYLCYCPLQYSHCYIDLRMGFDAYQKKFSAKTRSTIQRKIRKFTEHCKGKLEWRTYKQAHEMQEFLRLAQRVSKHTYQEKLFDAGIPATDEFLQAAQDLAANDSVRAYLLFDAGEPVSYLYCPVREDSLIYAYLGYRPDYRDHSVGTVLQWLALEQLFSEQRFRCFDFTEGQSDHKMLFSTHQLQCANIFLLRPGMLNSVIVRLHLLTDQFSAWIGARLEDWGIKVKVRRLMRAIR